MNPDLASLVELHVLPDGRIRYIHDDRVAAACRALGETVVRRASFVEPDDDGGWIVDLAPVRGPLMVGFESRAEALHAEYSWLRDRLGHLNMPEPTPAGSSQMAWWERVSAHPKFSTAIGWLLWSCAAFIACVILWMVKH